MTFKRFGGLSRRIYLAFLLAAAIPTAIAGIIGVYYSLEILKSETLHNLGQEVGVRAQGIFEGSQRFIVHHKVKTTGFSRLALAELVFR